MRTMFWRKRRTKHRVNNSHKKWDNCLLSGQTPVSDRTRPVPVRPASLSATSAVVVESEHRLHTVDGCVVEGSLRRGEPYHKEQILNGWVCPLTNKCFIRGRTPVSNTNEKKEERPTSNFGWSISPGYFLCFFEWYQSRERSPWDETLSCEETYSKSSGEDEGDYRCNKRVYIH